jgi:hypothetical protein
LQLEEYIYSRGVYPPGIKFSFAFTHRLPLNLTDASTDFKITQVNNYAGRVNLNENL